MEWDKLRIFIAVARSRTLAEAADKLKVNHTTVFRNMNQLEEALNLKLFIRSKTGYKLTDVGEEFLKGALQVEETVLALEREVLGRDTQLRGHIRVTTMDTLGLFYLSKHLIAFKERYPEVTLEILPGHQTFDLAKREADVAIRSSVTPKGDVVGRRISSIAFSVYGHKDLLPKKGAKLSEENGFGDLPFLELDASFSSLHSYQWLEKRKQLKRAGIRCNSLLTLMSLAENKGGLALLPCYHGDGSSVLRRVTQPDPALGAELWILTNREFRHNSRIRAFMDFFYEILSGEADAFEGKRASSPKRAT